MRNLKIDFDSLLPYVIDAFTAVCGEEYRFLISKKINNAFIVQYHNIEGLSDYFTSLKIYKKRELSVKFLDSMGVDVQKYKDNYTKPLDESLENILNNLIGSIYVRFSKKLDNVVPIKAFNRDNINKEINIKVVNFLLGDEHEIVTEESFDEFSLTDEYLEVVDVVNELNVIYEDLLVSYNEFLMKILPYEEYIKSENKRKEEILKEKKNEVYEEAFRKLPSSIKDIISNKTLEEQQDIILGSNDISSVFNIELFSCKHMEDIQSLDVSFLDKKWIILKQIDYLSELGVVTSNEKLLELVCCSKEDISEYLAFLSQDSVKKYIPTDEYITFLSSIREIKYEEALEKYYKSRDDFLDIMKSFGSSESNAFVVSSYMSSKTTCVFGGGARNNYNEFISLMFYAVPTISIGSLEYAFLHECGHVIDQNQHGIGFESADEMEVYVTCPYDDNLRIHEAFNEAINDILVTECIEYLHDNGIYLIEPQKFVRQDIYNINTNLLTKDLLKLLMQRFRKEVISAKIGANPDELIRCIGRDNYEELVDAVSKVHCLSGRGRLSTVEELEEDAIIEYFEQVKRVEKIYANIDSYCANNSSTDSLKQRRISF